MKELLRKNGMEVYDVDRSLFQNATKSVYTQYEDVYGKDLINRIIELGK
jgi:TRAP-type C4-dicarboxylate transport system substrate-binding protein